MKTILLIEDNDQMRENTAEILELSNYSVLTAKNGKIGVELAMKESPDLIICDIMMPVLDGYGVLHMLSKNPSTSSIPFIFLTAKAERSELRKGMEMGADDYLTKPFDDIELLNAVEVRLKKSEMFKSDFKRNPEGLDEFMSEAKVLEELKKLSGEREVRIYKKREQIYSEGSFPRGVHFVNKGRVKIFRSNPDGKELITALCKEGDFFGYIPLLEESAYQDSAVAFEDAEISLIPQEDFFALIYSNPHVSRKFIRMLSDNIAEKEDQLIRLAYNSVRKRVAEALVMLQDRYKKADEKNFSIVISREDLANIVGTSQETAIRMLSDFKEEKLVEIDGSAITVTNYDRLARMKN